MNEYNNGKCTYICVHKLKIRRIMLDPIPSDLFDCQVLKQICSQSNKCENKTQVIKLKCFNNNDTKCNRYKIISTTIEFQIIVRNFKISKLVLLFKTEPLKFDIYIHRNTRHINKNPSYVLNKELVIITYVYIYHITYSNYLQQQLTGDSHSVI